MRRVVLVLAAAAAFDESLFDPDACARGLEHACAYKRTDIVSWLVSEEVVDPRAVEYALRVAELDADDANLRAITGMLVPNI